MQLYLTAAPQEVREALRYTRALAHAAYRIGPGSVLLRRDLLLDTRGGLLCVSDRDCPVIDQPEKLAAAVGRECGRRGFSGAVLDFDAPPSVDRRAFAAVLAPLLGRSQRTLFVPEPYGDTAGAAVLLNTAVSGGDFRLRLEEAAARYPRLALDLQRLTMDFTLPARSGTGRSLSRKEYQALTAGRAPAVFFSQELCARYFTYPREQETHFVLFDDAETLLYKLRLAEKLGIRSGFLLFAETADLLPRLFGRGTGR